MEVSNPDRVLFPEDGITKAELVGYYESTGPAMMPHVDGRPLTLERHPNGIHRPGFMQKNAGKHFPDTIERVEIPKREGGTTIYPVVHRADDIAYLANQGTISFHVWTSRLPQLDKADRIIFDLDPPRGDVDEVRTAARVVRSFLDELGLASIPMATGSKGYHVISPIIPSIETEHLASLTQAAAILLARREPELLTSEFRKNKRSGRVFVDWLRNRPGQTGIAPWSVRPRPGAPVAVPLTWEELDGTEPDQWTLRTIDVAGHGDPLAGCAESPSPAGEALEELASLLEAEGFALEPFDRFRS